MVAAKDMAGLGSEAEEVVGSLPLYIAASLLGLIFIGLTLARRRWGRVGLMLLALGWAFSELISATSEGAMSMSTIISVGVAVLVVLGLCSEATREWLTRGKRDAQVRLR